MRANDISISTYARICPPRRIQSTLSVSNTSKVATREEGLVEYGIENVVLEGEDGVRDILHLCIPQDADPSLAHANNNDSDEMSFEFNKVFDVDASQEQVFDIVVRDKLMEMLNGINCTVFAYGQTGSGKTFTVSGGESYTERGLIPRAVGFLFKEIERREECDEIIDSTCRVSFTEVYNEVIYDLLDPQQRSLTVDKRTPVQILEGVDGLIMRNVNVFEVSTEEEALGLFFVGNGARLSDSTTMNTVSSRSHAIFTLLLQSQGWHPQQPNKKIVIQAKVNLVDLAGSERMYKMNNTEGQIREAKSINLSLHYLEQVIVSLRNAHTGSGNGHKGKKKSDMHIPYRNSILTNVLRDSLGGNCKSCFILTMSLDNLHFEESISTCRFGQRCGEIKLQISANMEVDLRDQLKEQQEKVKELEDAMTAMHDMYMTRIGEMEARHTKALQDLPAGGLSNLNGSSGFEEVRRELTSEDRARCTQTVQSLIINSRKSLSIMQTAITTNIDGSMSDDDKERCEEIEDASMDTLFTHLETMDKSMLVELAGALGKLVQTVYIEREMLTFEERRRQQTDGSQQQQQQQELEAVSVGAQNGEEGVRQVAANLVSEQDQYEDDSSIVAAESPSTTTSELSSASAFTGRNSNNTNTAMGNTTTAGTSSTLSLKPPSSLFPSSNSSNNSSNNSLAMSNGVLMTPMRFNQSLDIDYSNLNQSFTFKCNVLQKGNYFYKYDRMGMKSMRFVCLSQDRQNIYWRRISGGTKPTIVSLSDFRSVEVIGKEGYMLCLHGKANKRSLKLLMLNTMEDANSLFVTARFWCDALNLLINQLAIPSFTGAGAGTGTGMGTNEREQDRLEVPLDIDIDPMMNLDLESPSSKSSRERLMHSKKLEALRQMMTEKQRETIHAFKSDQESKGGVGDSNDNNTSDNENKDGKGGKAGKESGLGLTQVTAIPPESTPQLDKEADKYNGGDGINNGEREGPVKTEGGGVYQHGPTDPFEYPTSPRTPGRTISKADFEEL